MRAISLFLCVLGLSLAAAPPVLAQKKQASPQLSAEELELRAIDAEARMRFQSGDKSGSLDANKRLLQRQRELHGDDHPSVRMTLRNYAYVLGSIEDMEEAVRFYPEALRLTREVLGPKDPETLSAMHGYASVLQKLDRSAEAEPLAVEALRLRREVLGNDVPETLFSLNLLATLLADLNRPREAEPLFEEALARSEVVFGARDPRTITVRANRARNLKPLGRTGEAIPEFAKVYQLSREVLGESDPETVRRLDNYAFALDEVGRYREAEPLSAEALRLSIAVWGERDPETLATVNNRAALLSSMGRVDEAEALYAENLRLRRELLGETHRDTLTSLNNYASILSAQGRSLEALPLYEEVMLASIATLGERDPDTMQSINNYGFVLQELQRPSEAVTYYLRALELRRIEIGPDHPDTIASLGNYGSVLIDLSRFDEALPVLEQAVEASREVLGESHPSTLIDLNNYAFLLDRLGRYDEAAAVHAEALRLRRMALGDRHPETLSSINNYAYSLLELQRPREALPLVRELVAANRKRAADLAEGGVRGASQQGRERQTRQTNEKLLVDTLWFGGSQSAGDHDEEDAEAFAALQRASAGSASRAVTEAAATRFASARGLDAEVEERQGLVREWAAIDAALVEASSGGEGNAALRQALANRLDAVEARIAAIDALLGRDAPEYFEILNQQAVDYRDLIGVLDPDEAVLFLVPTQLSTHIMAITTEGIVWERAPLTQDAIAEKVRDLRDGLEIRAGDVFLPTFDLDLAHALYRDLIAPAESALAGKSRVYVIADGALSRLPLGTLVTSPPPEGADFDDSEVLRDTGWLADKYALVQLPSVQSLVYIRRFALGSSGADDRVYAGFGAPVLGGEARTRGARSATIDPVDASTLVGDLCIGAGCALMNPDALRRLSSLPGTRSELEQIRDALGAGRSTLWLSGEMTEPAIRTADLAHTRILHLATHGFTSEEAGSLAEPGLVFTPPDTAQPGNDGYLAASEVVSLNLAAARWVILSACNTASPSGKPGETGLSGLAQAFFYAGAQSLLVSHWPVFDDIAPVLTVDALRRSEAGMPRAEALQAAMHEIRTNPELDAAHPAVWAPFVLVGDGR